MIDVSDARISKSSLTGHVFVHTILAMLDESTLQALEAILRSDQRPWPQLVGGSEIAELHFPRKLHADAHEVADAARTLGFEVELLEKAQLRESVTSAGLDVVVLVIKGVLWSGAALVGLHAVAKAANELPEHVRKLREKLRPYLPRAALLSPGLQLDPIHRWLDERYGPNQWRYDPDHVEAKQIGHVMVFHLMEERTGSNHLLAVDADEVTELPLRWLPEKTK